MSGRLGVVTVTYNSTGVLPEFLESVWRQTYPDFLLYIIDSGSTDETPARLREIADSRVRLSLQKKNIGFAAGSNLGIQMALEDGCETVMLLNNDTVFGPETFQKLADGLETFRCDMVTPKILYYDDPQKIWAVGGNLNRWLGYRHSHAGSNEQDDGRFDRPRRVTFAPFCCMVIRSEVFRKIGLLDEAYFTYVEDVDYCYRALKANLSIWVLPKCRLLHKVSSLTGSTSSFTVEHCTRNRMYYLRKHIPRRQAAFWYFLYRAYYALEYAAGRTSRERWELRRSAAERGWRLAGERQRSRT